MNLDLISERIFSKSSVNLRLRIVMYSQRLAFVVVMKLIVPPLSRSASPVGHAYETQLQCLKISNQMSELQFGVRVFGLCSY
jgi:hypothetical protein